MSQPQRPKAFDRLRAVAVAGAALAAATVMPSAAGAATPRAIAANAKRAARLAPRVASAQVINAKTDPTGAGQALTQGCANISNCKWHTTSVTPAYGPPRILGDVLYNCSPKNEEMDMAETAVGVADERAQTTSLSEKVSLKLSLELVGLASTSVEFEAFSKQAVTFKTGVEVENAVVVPPGFKGYTTTQLLSANVTGDMVVGDNLIQVQNVDMSFPGYQSGADKNDIQIIYNGHSDPVSQADITSRCDAANDTPTGQFGAAPTKPPTGTFKLTLCHAVAFTATLHASAASSVCATRRVTGPPPSTIGHATATLTARGFTYAAGTDRAARIQLNVRRAIRPGKYTLTLRQAGKRNTRVASYSTSVIPITIR